MHAAPFCLSRISYPQENDQSYNDMKHIVKTRNICKEIDKSILRNETLQEYQHNTILPQDDDL